METFSELKKPLENPHFQKQKQEALCKLADDMIDKPIVNLIKGFNIFVRSNPMLNNLWKRIHDSI